MMTGAELVIWLAAPSTACSFDERLGALCDFLADGTVKATSIDDRIIAVGPVAIATALPTLPHAAA